MLLAFYSGICFAIAMRAAKQSIPVGARIIAILYYLSAFATILLGLLFIIGGSALVVLFQDTMLSFIGTRISFVGAAFFFVASIFYFFLGNGLWKGRQWARIIAITLAVIGFVGSLVSLAGGNVQGFLGASITAIIGGYLLFNNKVRKEFS